MNEIPQTESNKSLNINSSLPDLVLMVIDALQEKKARKIRVLDVREVTTLTDFFIVCQGGSDTQIKALANNTTEKVKEKSNEHVWRKEGLDKKRWVVLDYVDVVVHIFDEETREFYGLENMWNDAKITSIDD